MMASKMETVQADTLCNIGMKARALEAVLYLMSRQGKISDFGYMAETLQDALKYQSMVLAGEIADLAEGAQR
jgi:hypothetical protein